MREHQSLASRMSDKSEVSIHFSQIHSIDYMNITALSYASQDEAKRLEAEARIIYKLGSNISPGLNTDFTWK